MSRALRCLAATHAGSALLVALLGCAPQVNEDIIMSNETRYFATFVGYDIPVKPRDPISASEAERAPTYYVATYKEDGNLSTWEKWLMRRFEAPLPAELLATPAAGDRAVFLAAVRHDDAVEPGAPFGVESALEAPEYFKATFDEAGDLGRFERIERGLMMRHEYEYSEAGKLARYRIVRPGQPDDVIEVD